MTKWLLWSNAHGAFFRNDRMGFTLDAAEALRFTFGEAAMICNQAALGDEPTIIIDGHEMPWHTLMVAPEDTGL